MAKPNESAFNIFLGKMNEADDAFMQLDRLVNRLVQLRLLVGWDAMTDAQYDALYARYAELRDALKAKINALP